MRPRRRFASVPFFKHEKAEGNEDPRFWRCVWISKLKPPHHVKSARPSFCHSLAKRMSKFGAAGSVNTGSPPGYQNVNAQSGARPQGSAKSEPIGLRATDGNVTRNWRVIMGIIVAVIVVAAFTGVAFTYSVGIDKPYQVREDSLGNVKESRNVEIFLQNGEFEDEGVICSGVFIRQTGEILTAAHCFYTQNPDSCDWTLTPYPHYPSTIEALTIEIMNVNKTGAKYAFTGQIVAWSGITDVAIIKPLPLTRSDGSVITANNQHYFNFADGGDIERGDILNAFGYDNAYFKKAFRTGPVMHPKMDIGTLIAAATEQVFVDAQAQQGASGSGWVDHEGNLVLAPLSFSWSYDNGYDIPDAYTDWGMIAISKPLVSRMLNPATPANGLHNQYLVPTLGIIAGGPVDAYTLWYEHSPAFYPATEMKGIIISALATQHYFNTTARCGSQAYEVTPPSLENAPLDVTLEGTPPTTFPEIPNGGDTNTLIILEAIEAHLNKGDWIGMGSDAGLGTVSGAILATGHWVGDVIRVKVRAVNVVAPSDETKNWEGIYSVTLQAVDPFWDVAYGAPFATYASLILVNDTVDPPSYIVPPGVVLPTPLRGFLPSRRSPHHARMPAPRKTEARRIGHAPPGTDISNFPTVVEHYMRKVAETNPSVRYEMERSARAREEFMRNQPAGHPPLYRQAQHHVQHPAASRQPPRKTHPQPQKHKPNSHVRQEPARRAGQHLRGRRQ